jgi:flagellar hook-associated protein FlgK
MMPPYDTIGPGAQQRTKPSGGTMQVDLTGNTSSLYYDITATVGVVDKVTGVVSTSQITYRVNNHARDMLNNRYDATAVAGGGTIVAPLTSQETLKAIMVDENGNEIAKFNGKYIDQPGYLKIVGGVGGTNTSSSSYCVAIDTMDSTQLGNPTGSPPELGTNWGFSHYFGLNNFFTSNAPIASGDTLKNSAIHLAVADRIVADPNLISTGKIALQNQPADVTKPAQYTYVLYSGDNSVAVQLANLSKQTVAFDQAGGLPNTSVTLQAYTSNFLGYTASQTNAAADTATNAKALYDGFKSRQQATTGVNLDEELANTITFQNAYSATARVVSVVNQMYESLIQAV